MGQFKIYGLASELNKHRAVLSDIVHSCLVDALKFPADKRFQRFFPLAAEDFIYPAGRSQRYTIIELTMFSGRSVQAKKQFIKLIYQRCAEVLDLSPNDIEITISESPPENWGIRGLPGDELNLDYKIKV